MGKLDVSDTYCDSIKEVAVSYITSLTGFWFDLLTSLPWSINDLYSLQVRQPPLAPLLLIKDIIQKCDYLGVST
jgi:hypothetical protein